MALSHALLVVDVQSDFCEGGALEAFDTLSLLPVLKDFIDHARKFGVLVVYTVDWHPPNHRSFVTEGGPWPIHCVAGSPGAALMPPLEIGSQDAVIRKGITRDVEGYSAFEATDLSAQLGRLKIASVAICGIATEYCVHATAVDAAKSGLQTTILTDLIRAVNPAATASIVKKLIASGVELSVAVSWLEKLKARK